MDGTQPQKKGKWKWLIFLFLVLLLSVPLVVVYVRTHPLVFMDAHAHCIKYAALVLLEYTDKNQGRFPYHPKGYGNALLFLDEDSFNCLTGPGYDAGPFHEAKRLGRDLPEEECGRVYVQGLTIKCDGQIALLFDKLPTPGGDHCHLPARIWAPLGREVCYKDGHSEFVRESDWPEFAEKQVNLLEKEGIARQEAERLYASKGEYKRKQRQSTD